MSINTVQRVFKDINITSETKINEIIDKSQEHNHPFFYTLKKFFYNCITLGFGKSMELERSERRKKEIMEVTTNISKFNVETNNLEYNNYRKGYKIYFETNTMELKFYSSKSFTPLIYFGSEGVIKKFSDINQFVDFLKKLKALCPLPEKHNSSMLSVIKEDEAEYTNEAEECSVKDDLFVSNYFSTNEVDNSQNQPK